VSKDQSSNSESLSVVIDSDSSYQTHLNRVSRSFAFCIAELKTPLRSWVGLSYILCRLADTLEDAIWQSRETQLEALEKMKRFVQVGYSAAELQQWKNSVPTSIPESEKELLGDADRFFKDLSSLAPPVQTAICETLVHMIDGMAHFVCEAPPGSKLKIDNLAHANQYCFFVAGIVGELLTKLVLIDTPDFTTSEKTWVDGIHFGLFLQKINLLKDQMGDAKEGRFLVHSREDFKASLGQNARGSLRYLCSIPVARRDYRLFCAWSLYLGLASLPWIEKSWLEQSAIKISRTEAALVLAKVRFKIDNNQALETLFEELMVLPELTTAVQISAPDMATSSVIEAPGPGASTIPAWLTQIYHGEIKIEDLKFLGLG
jgi:phytoene/squalene synthetase